MSEFPDKSWELSPYEVNRKAQGVIKTSRNIAVSSKSLYPELRCPICLDLLTVTMTTVECLHRFCNECIVTALRSGNKECPTCRKKLISKRSLRPDPNFDQLVSKIYPDKEDCDEQQEKARFVHAKRLCKKRHLSEDVSEVSSSVNEEESSRSLQLRLLTHTDMQEALKTKIKTRERTIETVASANISHLVEYVRLRLGIELGLESKVGKENSDQNIRTGRLTNINIFKLNSKGALDKLDENQSLSNLSDQKELLKLYFNFDLEMMKA